MQVKMPPRRRGGRVKAKTKTPRETRSRATKESSSAEDTDDNTAKEIVKRLAKKYLLKSSTDTTDSEQKENVKGQRQAVDPYDGDLETDGGVTTTSDMECQTDESSLMEDQDVLSPSRKMNKQTNMAKTATLQRRKRGQQTSSRKTRQQKKNASYEKQKNSSKQRSDVDQASRGSQTDSEYEPQSSSKKSKLNSLQQGDSGFHFSPLTYGRPMPRLPRMNASDTSTPSSAIGPQRSLDDSCFGFDHIMSPQGLPYSPVQSVTPEDGHRPGSSMSSSMSSFAGSSIMSPPKRKYDNVVLAGLIPSESEQREMPAAKKPKKKKMPVKVQKTCDENWASKMSAEFDDIDMYELTIEG